MILQNYIISDTLVLEWKFVPNKKNIYNILKPTKRQFL